MAAPPAPPAPFLDAAAVCFIRSLRASEIEGEEEEDVEEREDMELALLSGSEEFGGSAIDAKKAIFFVCSGTLPHSEAMHPKKPAFYELPALISVVLQCPDTGVSKRRHRRS